MNAYKTARFIHQITQNKNRKKSQTNRGRLDRYVSHMQKPHTQELGESLDVKI